MEDIYLPIGTIVTLKKDKQKIMITGYFCSNDKKAYEYSGCIYPYGIGNNKEAILFNHKNINKVIFVGFYNEECKEYIKKLLKVYQKYTNIMKTIFNRIIEKNKRYII